MKDGKFERTPKPDKILNKDGEQFWELYCHYYLDRDSLTPDVLPDIETLCFQQQKRVQLQRELSNTSDEELLKSLNRIITQIRMLKKQMRIYPRANEFTKAYQEEAENNKEESPKMKLLQKKKNF